MARYNVIFDMDGVIFDSERTLYECWIDMARKYDLDEKLVSDTYIRCIGTNNNQTTEIYENVFVPILGYEKTRALWDECVELHSKRYSDGILPMKPGVKESLEYLHKNGVKIGIASSSRNQTVENQVKVAGLLDYFDGIVGGDAVKISKPNPEIYLLACDKFGFEPKETFAIEDSFNGIRAANAAGMRAIMVPDMIPADEEMRSLSEAVCEDLYGVIEYLESL